MVLLFPTESLLLHWIESDPLTVFGLPPRDPNGDDDEDEDEDDDDENEEEDEDQEPPVVREPDRED